MKRIAPAKSGDIENIDLFRVGGIATLVSLFSFLYYAKRGDLLLYGDAVAHINIARRVFDSQTPCLLGLGTVWLPLPHLLMIPFIWSRTMWQTGTGGSFPSMIAYVLGTVGVFRLVHGLLDTDVNQKDGVDYEAAVGAWAAALVYAANPNLIYMQATAMTESVYLALFVWAVVYFAEFLRSLPENKGPFTGQIYAARSPLMRCGWCVAGAELTRYDGWFLAGVIGGTTVAIGLMRWLNRNLDQQGKEKQRKKVHDTRRLAVKFLLVIAIAPILWLAYNRVVYGDALNFANGPYSARAIEQRVGAPNPALHSPRVAAIYFLKSAQLNMADGNWGRFWLGAALLAAAISVRKLRLLSAPILLLWTPLVFYALSIAYGSVPIHVYTWWPFATFNQRYGLQLLPMFAVSAGMLIAWIYSSAHSTGHGGKVAALMLVLIGVSYGFVWNAGPQCLQEAKKNWNIRHVLNSEVQQVVSRLPGGSRFLMDLGEHVGVMQQAGIPLRQVINNENHRPWMHPSDPEGLWERALADPPRYVDYVVAFEGDAVDQSVNKNKLTEIVQIHASGQPHARIYSTQIVPAAYPSQSPGQSPSESPNQSR